MKTLTEVLERKGREVVSIGPDAIVYEEAIEHGGEMHRGSSGRRRRPALRHLSRTPYTFQRSGATQLPSSAVSRR